MPKVNEVFGITRDVPKYTYVNRSQLDETLDHYLTLDRHIVIHGASKQGKTSLRRKCLPDNKTIFVSCHGTSSVHGIYEEILRQLGAEAIVQRARGTTRGGNFEADGSVHAGAPFFGKATVGVNASANVSHTSEQTTQFVGLDAVGASNPIYVAEQIKSSQKRCVLDDFHYLPEKEKVVFARDLKAFWDRGVFFIIAGILPEHDFLLFYNPDLDQRVEQIDVQWSDLELLEVLERGGNALNISFADNIRGRMIADALHNVGLLQTLAEKYCEECGVSGTLPVMQILSSDEILSIICQRIAHDKGRWYKKFLDVMHDGFRQRDRDTLKMYEKITQTFIEAPVREALAGFTHRQLLGRIQKRYPALTNVQSVLTASLRRLNRLQEDNGIYPLVISYSEENQRVHLIDRVFLFYSKYGNPTWPWASSSGN